MAHWLLNLQQMKSSRIVVAATMGLLTVIAGSRLANATTELVNVSVNLPDVGGSLRLRGQGEGAREYVCVTSCALQLPRGHYDIQIADARGPYATRGIDLFTDETIDVRPPNRGLAAAGVVVVVMGGATVGISAGIFMYGAVTNLETLGCDTSCSGGVSLRTMRLSLLGLGGGLALAGIGAIMVASSGSSFIEQHQLALALLPNTNGGRSPVALLGFRF
jgi:hypothetical protein